MGDSLFPRLKLWKNLKVKSDFPPLWFFTRWMLHTLRPATLTWPDIFGWPGDISHNNYGSFLNRGEYFKKYKFCLD